MTGWDRVSWACSWVAPVAWGLTLASLVFALGSQSGFALLGLHRKFWEMGVLVFGAIGALAHSLLVYRVHKEGAFARDDASRLAGLLHFGVGYSEWRDAVRRRRSQ